MCKLEFLARSKLSGKENWIDLCFQPGALGALGKENWIELCFQ